MTDKTFDIVVFGATSFVGQILSSYLLERHGVDGEVKWAIAGRSTSKLGELQESLGEQAAALPTLVADAADTAALEAMCAQARVVVSTVGPYALYGSPLVEICARTGTDYCDLTGEVQWIRRMLDQHEAAARKSGARIVHCCGFDSIPSDLGVLHHQALAQERFGKPSPQVHMRVKRMRGGASGGTVASLMNVVEEARRDPKLRKSLLDPYLLCPTNGAARVRQDFVSNPRRTDVSGYWVAPFVMAAINTRIVLRSNAIAGHPYGTDFRYDEAMITGRGIRGGLFASGFTAGLGGFMTGAAIPPAAWLLKRFVVPKPGEGPSPEEQRNGLWEYLFFSESGDGHDLVTRVTGDRDPGYGSTAKMLGEAALRLSQVPKTEVKGGFWTPATALGEPLIQQLVQHAGLTFSSID